MSSAAAWTSSSPTPTRWQQLAADPAGLLPSAVEEMLRWVTPIKNMARIATRDVELAGAQIKAGQELLLLYPSANRDEAVFEHADTFDITRSPNPHLAFGFGAHFCLGNQLARLELRVMVERILARLPDLRLATERAAAAAAAGQLHLRHRGDAGGVHAQRPGRGRPRLMPDSDEAPAGIAGWSILVTGGGSGIGLATAERFAADGAHVTICGRTEQKLADATERITAAATGGATARYVVADVTVEEQVARGGGGDRRGHRAHRRPVRLRRGSLHLGSVLDRRRRRGAGHHRPQPHRLGHLREAGRRGHAGPGRPRLDRAHVLGRRPLPPPAPVGLRRLQGRHLLPDGDRRRGARPARDPGQRGGARASSPTS